MTALATAVAETVIGASATALYRRVSERAASLNVGISPEELAELVVRLDMGEDWLAALEAIFTYLADKYHDHVISTLQAEPSAAEGPQDLRGVRLRPHARPGRRRAAQAVGALEPTRAEEHGIHRSGRNRENPPCASLRQSMLP